MSSDASMPPTVAEIDLAAFAHNIQVVRAVLPATCRILAVLKADAYGHGALPLARVAQQQGVAYLGVAVPRRRGPAPAGDCGTHSGLGPTWPRKSKPAGASSDAKY